MLDDFRIPVKDRVILFENLYKNFLPEFVDFSNKKYVKLYKASLDKQHRDNKDFLDQILRKKNHKEIEKFILPYIKRTKCMSKVAEEIKINNNNNDVLSLLQSYIHMNLNRLFFTKARMHELVIYYLMFQTYNSILNRTDTN
jgi:thiopeptide-type bacteriocin biosynthesis protein